MLTDDKNGRSTPRTDAWEQALSFPRGRGNVYNDAYFDALAFARSLEMELAESRMVIQTLHDAAQLSAIGASLAQIVSLIEQERDNFVYIDPLNVRGRVCNRLLDAIRALPSHEVPLSVMASSNPADHRAAARSSTAPIRTFTMTENGMVESAKYGTWVKLEDHQSVAARLAIWETGTSEGGIGELVPSATGTTEREAKLRDFLLGIADGCLRTNSAFPDADKSIHQMGRDIYKFVAELSPKCATSDGGSAG